MSELTELGKVLHEEHFRILVSICGLENRVTGPANEPLDPRRAEDEQQLQDLMAALAEVLGHHAFEEALIFPLIRRGGDSELVGMLAREHRAIEPMAARLRTITAKILQHGIDAENWQDFREAARELIDEVMRHLQKEESNIVQRLGAFLDHETDHQLAIGRLAAERAKARHASAAAAVGPPQRSDANARVGARRVSPAAAAARLAARRRSTSARHPSR